jgi:hypothetical protein
MTKRECLLSAVWTGPPLKLDGQELRLPFGRFELLRRWGNIIFSTGSEREQSETAAVHECAWIMAMSKESMIEALSKARDELDPDFVKFCATYEDELPEIIEGVIERLQQLKAAMVESVAPGKGDARHAS